MIDSIVRAAVGSIQYLVKDYFILNATFSQDLNVNMEFQRTFEHNNVKDMKFLDSDVDGRALLVYNRDPIVISQQQRVARRSVYSDIPGKNSEFRDFYIGDVTINCKIGTNVFEALSIMESLYNIKLFGNKDIEISIQLVDELDPINITYSTEFSNINSIMSDNFEQNGQFWTADFNIKLSGPILSPEAFDYPRILRIKDNYFIAKDDKEFSLSRYEYTHQTDITIDDSGNESGRTAKVYRDVDTIIARFPTQRDQ